MKRACSICAVVVFLVTRGAFAQTVEPNLRLADVIPGQTMDVAIEGLAPTERVLVIFKDEANKDAGVWASKVDDERITATVPRELVPGRYLVRIEVRKPNVASAPIPIPGELEVRAIQPKILGIAPEETAYSSDLLDSRFEFRVVGENFVEEHTSLVTPNGEILAVHESECDEQDLACLRHDAADPTRVLHVTHFPRYGDYTGEIRVAARVEGVQSAQAVKLVLSRIPKGFIFVTALAISLLLAAIVGSVLSAVRGRMPNGRRYGLLPAFVLDKETNTYSLSKLQLLLWSAAGVFGYIYFFLCKVLVQWQKDFPDVPDGLPLLLGVSGGTTVVAAAVQANRGAKGSGPVHPSWADFISSGGVVVAERFQFFIWTIIGIIGFLGLLLAADPASFNNLPKIPDQFLALMGISSLAYLGGKAVRKPGPVVRTATLHEEDTGLRITIDGLNIETDAKVRFDSTGEPFKPEGVARISQGDVANPNWHKQMTFVIPKGSKEWEALATGTREHTIEVINADAQSGSAMFVSNPPALDAARSLFLTTGAGEQELTLSGENFVDNMTAEWTPPGATTPGSPRAVEMRSPAQATVGVTAEKPGSGKLTLIPPIGAPSTTTVTVVDAQSPPSSPLR